MEKTNYLIYGGGSHSRVIISILEKMGVQIKKYLFWGIINLKLIQNVN